MMKLTKRLEDLFFFKEDLKLKEELQALRQMKETTAALREASGIQDEVVLRKLVELNIRPETAATLAVVPLIEVAWANGTIDGKEKKAVLEALTAYGCPVNSIDYVLVERWLEHKPDPSLLQAWCQYIQSIRQQMSPDELGRLKAEILAHAAAVGRASGGILGVGAVSGQEQHTLAYIRNAFEGAGPC